MRLLPETSKNSRFLALVLTLIVALLGYLLFVHWWFVAPHLAINAQMEELREQEQHFRAVIEQRAEIDKKLAEVRGYEQSNQAFLAQTDANAASADLIQRLKQSVTKFSKEDANRCQVVTNQTITGGRPELYQKVTIQVNMRCDMEPLADILYELENGKPYLFVDQLMIYKQNLGFVPPGQKRQPQPSSLSVRFNLSGYVRQRGTEKG